MRFLGVAVLGVGGLLMTAGIKGWSLSGLGKLSASDLNPLG